MVTNAGLQPKSESHTFLELSRTFTFPLSNTFAVYEPHLRANIVNREISKSLGGKSIET